MFFLGQNMGCFYHWELCVILSLWNCVCNEFWVYIYHGFGDWKYTVFQWPLSHQNTMHFESVKIWNFCIFPDFRDSDILSISSSVLMLSDFHWFPSWHSLCTSIRDLTLYTLSGLTQKRSELSKCWSFCCFQALKSWLLRTWHPLCHPLSHSVCDRSVLLVFSVIRKSEPNIALFRASWSRFEFGMTSRRRIRCSGAVAAEWRSSSTKRSWIKRANRGGRTFASTLAAKWSSTTDYASNWEKQRRWSGNPSLRMTRISRITRWRLSF